MSGAEELRDQQRAEEVLLARRAAEQHAARAGTARRREVGGEIDQRRLRLLHAQGHVHEGAAILQPKLPQAAGDICQQCQTDLLGDQPCGPCLGQRP